jgi:DNA-binding CsgD family transcriptional regulator
MKKLCQSCDKKALCEVLCPEAELYVDEDSVEQNEMVYGLRPSEPLTRKLRKDLDDLGWLRPKIKLSKMEAKIVTLMVLGKKYKEIRKELNITKHNFDNIIFRLRKKSLNRP